MASSRETFRSTRLFRLRLALATLLVAGACGDDPTEPDLALGDLVASWDAIRFVVEDKANPSRSADLIAVGMTFFLDVQPSGGYTAILTAFGIPNTEFGRIEVRGNNELIFHREHPGPPRSDAGTFRISGDTLFVTGETEFDFNADGNPEPSRLRTDLLKRR
jgi:hypothetical protein